MKQNDLVAAVHHSAREDLTTSWYPTVSEDAINAAEEILGLKLPTLLARFYREISNGGFGPGFRIGGLPGGHECAWAPDLITAVQDLDVSARDDDEWEDGWLPLIDWGCGQCSVVDALDENRVITWLEGEAQPEEYDFDEMMERWTKGEEPDILVGGFKPVQRMPA